MLKNKRAFLNMELDYPAEHDKNDVGFLVSPMIAFLFGNKKM